MLLAFPLSVMEMVPMAIKLAFSTSLCPAWDVGTLVSKCQVLGLQGIEIEAKGAESAAWVTGSLLGEPAVTRKRLEDAGLQVACLTTGVELHHADHAGAQRAHAAAVRAIELAAALGAPVVRVLGLYIGRGESPSTVMHRVGTRLAGLAETASAAGVRLGLQNAGNFVRAKELWMICEVANHAGVGVCWDVGAGAVVKESPTLSVPTLNSRIAHVQMWDGTGLGTAEQAVVGLGTGEVRNKVALERLRGIGYAGFVSYVPPVGGLEDGAVGADLAVAAKQMRAWLGLPELGPDGKVVEKVAAPAAKPGSAAKAVPGAAGTPVAAAAAPAAAPPAAGA